MITTLTIAGVTTPLTQVTLRRSADAAEMSLQMVGHQSPAVGAAVTLTVGDVVVSGLVASINPGARSTACTASVTTDTGAGVYAPRQIHYRSTGTVRGDVDFSVLPGDTYSGLIIREVTHTIGTTSSAFTEVRF